MSKQMRHDMDTNASAAIVELVTRRAKHEKTTETSIPRVSLHYSDVTTEAVPAFYRPSFCLIVQGRKEVLAGGVSFSYGAGEYLVAGFDVPVIGAITQASQEMPYVCFQLTFDRPTLLKTMSKMPLSGPLESINKATANAHLLDAVARLTELVESDEDTSFLAHLYELEILYRLLKGRHASQLLQYAYADERTMYVERAIDHIRATYCEPFDLAQLLQASGRSQSALYRDFKCATGISPLQYRTRLRLQEVRRLMLTENLGAAEAGYTVGYESPSQLNREYRRLYGRPPAEDVSQLRIMAKSSSNTSR